MGRSVKVIDECRIAIEAAGFTNVQEVYFKLPIGTWPKNRRLKEAGRISLNAWTGGLEGFVIFLLTKFGEIFRETASYLIRCCLEDSVQLANEGSSLLGSPQPWTQEEVLAYTADLREEFQNRKNHVYHYA